MSIDVTETEYRGNFFRSRLEARWARFFYTLGVLYQYEVDRYSLGNGDYYLPDFWLPDLRCFIEVKPEGMKGDERIILLSNTHRDARYTMLLTGEPWPDDYRLIVYKNGIAIDQMFNGVDGTFVWALFNPQSHPYTLGCVMRKRGNGRYLGYIGPTPTPGSSYSWPENEQDIGPLMEAYTVARRARFEKGIVSAANVNVPMCPKCNSRMVERNRKKDGEPFWGCSVFPQCKGTRPAWAG